MKTNRLHKLTTAAFLLFSFTSYAQGIGSEGTILEPQPPRLPVSGAVNTAETRQSSTDDNRFEVDRICYIASEDGLTCEVANQGSDTPYTGDVVIPEKVSIFGKTMTVTGVANYAILACRELTTLKFPESVTKLGKYAFYACGLTDINIPNSITEIPAYAFNRCNQLTNVSFGNKITKIGYAAFASCSSLKAVDIPNSVAVIDTMAFSDCSSLATLTIPETTTTILMGAFQRCPALTEVTLPSGMTEVSPHLFNGCTGLTELNLPESITKLGEVAFRNCSGLTSVTIPSSVTEVGSLLFSGCTGLTSVISKKTIPPVKNTMIFDQEVYNEAVLIVPTGSVTAYKSTKPWTWFKHIEGRDVTAISDVTVDDNKPDVIYDLQGRRLNAPKPGLNIINGKKVFIGK